MRTTFMIIIVLLVLLVGCSTSPANENVDTTVSSTDMTDNTVSESDDTSETKDSAQTMRFCKSTKQTDLFKYEYYWTQDEYFEKVVTGNGGETRKIATPQQVCVFLAGSAGEGWDCSAGSEALFQETKGVVEDLVSSPVDIYGLVCNDVPYDATVFEVSDN